jgi:hypothetical protein
MQAPMTADDVRELMREKIAEAGSMRRWASEVEVSTPYLSDVLAGNRRPSEAICRALGLRMIVSTEVTYEPLENT